MREINSVEDLIYWNNRSSIDENRFLFRGMSNESFKLIPKISREENRNISTSEEIAKKRQTKLKEYLNLRLPAYNLDFHGLSEKHKTWREVMIAQHYGVPTHLLDFTRNPMVALFFAVNESDKDGILWAIRIKKKSVEVNVSPDDNRYNIASYDLISGDGGRSPYELKNSFFVVPPQFDARIRT